MAIVSGVVWGGLNLAFLFLITKFYFPILIKRYTNEDIIEKINDEDEKKDKDTVEKIEEVKVSADNDKKKIIEEEKLDKTEKSKKDIFEKEPETEENSEEASDEKTKSKKDKKSQDKKDKKKDDLDSKEEKDLKDPVVINDISKNTLIILCSISAIVALICGYVLATREVSGISMAKIFLAFCILGASGLTDLKMYVIPNIFVVSLVVLRAVFLIPDIILESETWLYSLVGCVIGAVICLVMLLLSYKLTHGGIGFGDIKLLSGLGLFLGLRATLSSLIFALLICSIASIYFLSTKKKNIKDGLPLGPFIWIGFSLATIIGVF